MDRPLQSRVVAAELPLMLSRPVWPDEWLRQKLLFRMGLVMWGALVVDAQGTVVNHLEIKCMKPTTADGQDVSNTRQHISLWDSSLFACFGIWRPLQNGPLRPILVMLCRRIFWSTRNLSSSGSKWVWEEGKAFHYFCSLSPFLSTSLSLSLSIYVSLSVCLPVCLSVCLPVCLCFQSSLHMSLSIQTSVHLSARYLCLYVYIHMIISWRASPHPIFNANQS